VQGHSEKKEVAPALHHLRLRYDVFLPRWRQVMNGHVHTTQVQLSVEVNVRPGGDYASHQEQ
jgi:hypothetical protein